MYYRTESKQRAKSREHTSSIFIIVGQVRSNHSCELENVVPLISIDNLVLRLLPTDMRTSTDHTAIISCSQPDTHLHSTTNTYPLLACELTFHLLEPKLRPVQTSRFLRVIVCMKYFSLQCFFIYDVKRPKDR